VRKNRNNSGFSLVELLTVIVILNILAAVGITLYVGVREKARRAGMTKLAVGSKAELQHWLQSSFSQNHNIREIDTNFSGRVEDRDADNGTLYNNVATLYCLSRNSVIGDKSPWFDVPLWNSSDPPVPGTISLTQPKPDSLKVVATGKNGEIVTQYDIGVY
jgi:prepilin-type N-terminal cleavage/methylation domain-containing protein